MHGYHHRAQEKESMPGWLLATLIVGGTGALICCCGFLARKGAFTGCCDSIESANKAGNQMQLDKIKSDMQR